MNPLELTLGIMTAVGGFVDISELVFAAQAGSLFGYALMWVFLLGTIGMGVFGEMAGRVAAIAKQPVFNLIRHRLGLNLGLVTLIGSLLSTLVTCAAEVGGMGLILHYLTGAPYLLMAIVSTVALFASMWVLPFKWIERTYGMLGLLMITFAVGLVAIHPPWAKVAAGLVPQVPRGLSSRELLTFAYFTVAILSAVLFPYESYFYSSGGIEEQWGAKDLLTNRITCTVGFGSRAVDPGELDAAFRASACGSAGPGNDGYPSSNPAWSSGTDLCTPWHVVRCCRRSSRNMHEQCLCSGAILRLGMGPAQETVGSAALHHCLDRRPCARPHHCPHGR